MSTKQLIVGTAGIYAAYLTLSLVNERLFTHEYINVDSKLGEQYQKDKFKFPDLCICISSLFCAIFSFLRSKYQKDAVNPIPFKEYIILGILYTINILAASYALLYISYPVRVVSDKCGYLTAVVVGVYFSRIKKGDVKLEPKKVLIAIIITAGAVLFAFAREQQASKAWELVYNPDTLWVGYLLMFISISGQALFTDSQAFCKITYKPTINHLMFTVNIMTALICLISIIVKGDLIDSMMFCKSHPYVIVDIVLIGLLQVLGQVSIYFIVLNFKQHIFPLVSTTRKVFTVLLSIFIFNHKMNGYQWMALILVFGGMGYELVDELYSDIFKKKIKRADSKRQSQIHEEQVKKEEEKAVLDNSAITLKSSQKQGSAIVQNVQPQPKGSQAVDSQEDPWYYHLKMEPQDYQLQSPKKTQVPLQQKPEQKVASEKQINQEPFANNHSTTASTSKCSRNAGGDNEFVNSLEKCVEVPGYESNSSKVSKDD